MSFPIDEMGDTEDAGFSFEAADVDYALPMPEQTAAWLANVVRKEQAELGSVTFIFCSDTYLLDYNIRYLGHDTLTDVITFPYSETKVEGDIFISIDRVKENASEFGLTMQDELHRVMVHGVLHLLGFDDYSDEDRASMRLKEEQYLALREPLA